MSGQCERAKLRVCGLKRRVQAKLAILGQDEIREMKEEAKFIYRDNTFTRFKRKQTEITFIATLTHISEVKDDF